MQHVTARMTTTMVALSMVLAAGAASDALAMDRYLWKYRPLVVFAASPGDPQLQRQREIVASLRPAFIDRNVVVVYVGGDTVTTDLGPQPGMGAAALRQRYGVAPGTFKAVLVGKDGGVKLTAAKPLAAQTLFRTIDAMPMRADEVRKK